MHDAWPESRLGAPVRLRGNLRRILVFETWKSLGAARRRTGPGGYRELCRSVGVRPVRSLKALLNVARER